MDDLINSYTQNLTRALGLAAMQRVPALGHALLQAWRTKKTIYLCGNGGSAGNAIHLANDLIYGAGLKNGSGLRVEALSANPAVLTCLANDLGYEQIYAEQIRVKGNAGDILIVLSGSGNSPNIIRAINQAKKMNIKSYAILGFDGGQCKDLADVAIHFSVNDMQIAEDMQIVVGHMIMQWLYINRPKIDLK